jgi:thiamine biosynthesis lipoprotein
LAASFASADGNSPFALAEFAAAIVHSPMNRRTFLQPRSLAAQIILEPPPAEATLVRYARRAMATTFEVVFPYGQPESYDIAEDALDEIDRLESQLTVYRESSEVSRLNRLASHVPVPVEESLFGLLSLAARISADTGGAFDITAGALIKAWGFFRGPRRVPSPDALEEALRSVGMQHVTLVAESKTVRYSRPGLEINLGSIGKGHALDVVAAMLAQRWGVRTALLHGGHSSVYALGGGPADSHGWEVGITHPWNPNRRLAMIYLRDRALGTSAATFQHLEHVGRKLGHILDPRSGWPAQGMASASVVAPTAAEADALATAFFILGVEPARAYCETRPEIGALLLPEEAARPTIIGLSPRDITLCEIGTR